MTASAAALSGLSLVAALSFVRIFEDEGSIVAGALAAVFTHAVFRVARAARLTPPATGMLLVGGLGLLLTYAIAPGTTLYGLPTGETFQLLGERLGDGVSQIRTEDIPIGPHSGVVAVAALGLAFGALAADWVAFRARAVLSAAIPATTLFTLTASLGDDRFQVPLTIAFVALALTFVLAHAPAQAGDSTAWFTTATRTLGPGAALRAGLPVVLAAAILAPVLGPRLPEARSAGLVDLRNDGEGPRTRVTVSPLVDIRDRLTQDPPVEVFTVSAERPTYWRMAALETYDGLIWSSLADYEKAGDSLPEPPGSAPTLSLTQTYQISGLAQFWLPAAYQPVSIDLAGARVNPDSLTLLTDQETADGLTYTIRSEIPDYGPAAFAGASGRVPEAVAPFLELPADTPVAARRLAAEVTAGHADPYSKAIALQNWFRANFEYSEEVPPGHSGDRMTDFLLYGRAGFCEQFSSSFAVMARSLGIPARVAVGFTPGTPDPASGSYVVTSREAHAWPEVFIAPLGWVAFEPTPTRFNPSPSNHTGTFNPDAQQAPPDAVDPEATATTVVDGGNEPVTGPAEPQTPAADDRLVDEGGGNPWLRRLALAAAVAVLAAVLAVVVGLERRRRARRARVQGLDSAGSILLAWDDVVAQLRLDGVELPDSLTPSEAALVAARREPELADPMEGLRHLVDRAAYSSHEPGTQEVAIAWAAARRVVSVLERDDTAARRMRRRLTV